MNKNIVNIAIFAAGALLGSVATWLVLRNKYEERERKEIEEIKAALFPEKNVDTEEVEQEPAECSKPDIPDPRQAELTSNDDETDEEVGDMKKRYDKFVQLTDYNKIFDDEEVTPVEEDLPKIIPPEEFGEIEDYDQISLTYYADGYLADDFNNYEVMEDIDAHVGKESLKTFGRYEEDSVYVRNDNEQKYYEILRSDRLFVEVVRRSQPEN